MSEFELRETRGIKFIAIRRKSVTQRKRFFSALAKAFLEMKSSSVVLHKNKKLKSMNLLVSSIELFALFLSGKGLKK